MRLGRLTGLEREKLEAEYNELWALTDYLEGLLADEKKLMAAIIDELKQIRERVRRRAPHARSSTPRARSSPRS